MRPRLCVIGAGTFGEMHLRAGLQLTREGVAELVGFADTNPELVRLREEQYGVTGYPDLTTMLDACRPDAVTIATPDFLHRDLAVACLERGIHVLTEKPMDTSVAGCEEMIAAADAAGCLLQVDFMKRKDPYHLDLERRVRTGQVGQVLYGYAWFEDKIEVPTKWLSSWAAKSDPAWFLGVHLFDLVAWTIRGRAVQVSATGAKVKLPTLGIDTYDSIQTRVVYDTGASFTFDLAWHFPAGGEALVHQGIKLVGSDGWMTVDSQDRGARGCVAGPTAVGVGSDQGQEAARMFTPNLGLFQADDDPSGGQWFRGYAIDSIAEFGRNVNFLANGGTLAALNGRYPSGADGLEATKVAVAVHDSLDTGGQVISLG